MRARSKGGIKAFERLGTVLTVFVALLITTEKVFQEICQKGSGVKNVTAWYWYCKYYSCSILNVN